MEIIKKETRYVVSEGKICVSMIKHHDGSISVFRQKFFNRGFDFVESKPEEIIAVTDLIKRATEHLKDND